MGPTAVVVLGIRPERPIEMPSTLDERPVEALRPDGFDHPLRISVGVWGSYRSQDYLCPFRTEDLIEWTDELGVPVSDEEPDGGRATIEVHSDVPSLLSDPGRAGMCGRGTQVDAPTPEFDEQQDIQGPETGGLDGEEVTGDHPLRLSP
jgi:hypothetical protein